MDIDKVIVAGRLRIGQAELTFNYCTAREMLRLIGEALGVDASPVAVGHDETPPEMLACAGCGRKTTAGAWLHGDKGDLWHCDNCVAMLDSTRATTQARHISLGEPSHKVSVTGMTRCKVCNGKIAPGQTFYFFGVDGPYCEACYAKDERRQKW